MTPLRISEDALQDLNEGFLFYEAQEEGLGDYFATQVSDLSPLVGLPLKELFMAGTLVTNLAPLAQLPLQVLCFNNTQVREVSPLLSIPTLTEIFLPTRWWAYARTWLYDAMRAGDGEADASSG